jgi:hypothetical protein
MQVALRYPTPTPTPWRSARLEFRVGGSQLPGLAGSKVNQSHLSDAMHGYINKLIGGVIGKKSESKGEPPKPLRRYKKKEKEKRRS